uniref:DUF834 domain-containing protein n=1 Tax=Oryza sativa subsp. japonica TaxID=39947 RepID=Q84YY6_ORYSJ|nr:hypothetical protein [Oryza sativa Japonica Group]
MCDLLCFFKQSSELFSSRPRASETTDSTREGGDGETAPGKQPAAARETVERRHRRRVALRKRRTGSSSILGGGSGVPATFGECRGAAGLRTMAAVLRKATAQHGVDKDGGERRLEVAAMVVVRVVWWRRGFGGRLGEWSGGRRAGQCGEPRGGTGAMRQRRVAGGDGGGGDSG